MTPSLAVSLLGTFIFSVGMVFIREGVTRPVSTPGTVLGEDRVETDSSERQPQDCLFLPSKNNLSGFPEAVQPDTLGSRKHSSSILK